MSYHSDYPKEPIGAGNPYYCCSACGRSDPEINGRLEGHSDSCAWRISEELKRDTTFTAALKTMKQLPQRQDALSDQLRDLRVVANKMGMYDAADFLRNVLEK